AWIMQRPKVVWSSSRVRVESMVPIQSQALTAMESRTSCAEAMPHENRIRATEIPMRISVTGRVGKVGKYVPSPGSGGENEILPLHQPARNQERRDAVPGAALRDEGDDEGFAGRRKLTVRDESVTGDRARPHVRESVDRDAF